MKPEKRELKRIEATLEHLNSEHSSQADASHGDFSCAPENLPQVAPAKSLQPFPMQSSSAAPSPEANLPQPKLLKGSAPRYAAQPHLAIGLLHQIEAIVQQWQTELAQVSQQIQALYEEGPIVDGWLESHPPNARSSTPPAIQSTGVSALRHADIEHLKEYVDAICSTPQPPFTDNQPRSGYRLCGLDAEGHLWSRPCPPQQVAYVSLAIARYQKLRTLLDRKQILENRLTQMVEDLTLMQGQMQEE